MAQHARESFKFMLGDNPELNQTTKEAQLWEAGTRMEPCDAQQIAQHSQDTLPDTTDTAPQEELPEFSFSPQEFGKALNMADKQSSPSASDTASTTASYLDDLLSANVLLKRQLMEAEEIQVPSAIAAARACASDAEQLRMKNSKLEGKLQEVEKALGSKIFASSASALREAEDLRAENMELQQQLHAAEKCFEENSELRRKLAEIESHMLILADENKNLRLQLSTQFKKCADAESQRKAQKELFCKLLESAKIDMDDCDGRHAKAVAPSDHAAAGENDAAYRTDPPAETVTASPAVPCATNTPKDEAAKAPAAQTSRRFLLPQHGARSPIRRCEGERRTEASPDPHRLTSRASSVAPEHEKSASNMQPAEAVLSKFVKTLDSNLSGLNVPHPRSPSASATSAITPNLCREIGRLALSQQSEIESDRRGVMRQSTAPSQLESSYRKLKPLRAAIAVETHVRPGGL